MKASSPEMETIWPRSSSPCSGVLKFRLASNASANVASAVSLDWVMGLLDTFREVDPAAGSVGRRILLESKHACYADRVARISTSARCISFPRKTAQPAAKNLREALARRGP